MHERARAIALAFAAEPSVEAVALAGSVAAGTSDGASDVDLYVYTREEISLEVRRAIVPADVRHVELDNRFFETGDEWIEADGLAIDVMFRSPRWIEDELDRVLVRHEARVGYSTCFWFNVLRSEMLFDRSGWFAALQTRANVTYPEPLVRAIIAKNYPLLRQNQSSFRAQLAKAIARGDQVATNHRLAALVASVFDCAFALERCPHPGEKRLVDHLRRVAQRTPIGLADAIDRLLTPGAPGQAFLDRADTVLDLLDDALPTPGGRLLPEIVPAPPGGGGK